MDNSHCTYKSSEFKHLAKRMLNEAIGNIDYFQLFTESLEYELDTRMYSQELKETYEVDPKFFKHELASVCHDILFEALYKEVKD